MKYPWIDEYLMKKPGVTRDLQKDWNWIRYQLDGKMFAAVCRDDNDLPYYITLKLTPLEGDFWRSQYEDIIPGYYMNKMHWNSVKADGNVPDDILQDLLDKAYRIVLGSLSKKRQKEILESSEKPCRTAAHEQHICHSKKGNCSCHCRAQLLGAELYGFKSRPEYSSGNSSAEPSFSACLFADERTSPHTPRNLPAAGETAAAACCTRSS